MTTKQLILLAHGSNDPDWREPFETLCQQLHPLPITLAYMEMAEPTLAMIVASLVNQPTPPTQIDILPLFMAQGGHLKHDVPRQVEAMRTQYPAIQFGLMPPVGQHPLVVQAMQSICQQWAV